MVWVVSLSTAKLIPRGLTPEIVALVFGVWFGRVVWEDPHPDSVSLPPTRSGSRLALKLFRRERAISQFDYTLSPPVSSSQTFSTVTRSALQAVLPALQPDQR